MNKDLEDQLDEMGPEYRSVVMRLRGAETYLTPKAPAGSATMGAPPQRFAHPAAAAATAAGNPDMGG